ncbi:MAG: hypothetical protein ACOYD4_10350 [Solirubrobacterales bacterium]
MLFEGGFARQSRAQVGRRRGEDDVVAIAGEPQVFDPGFAGRPAADPVGAGDQLQRAAVEVLDEALDASPAARSASPFLPAGGSGR